MKINKIKTFLAALSIGLLSSCVSDDDTKLPEYTPLVFGESFNSGIDNTILEIEGWKNYAQAGTARWKTQVYQNNGYAEFSSFQSGNPSNIGWLISPSINLDQHQGEKLVFQSAQSYVDNAANTLEVLISQNYDGTNVEAATWQNLSAALPTLTSPFFAFINSGQIDLSQYTGNVNIAFRVKGNGTTLDGSYQIDNVRVFY